MPRGEGLELGRALARETFSMSWARYADEQHPMFIIFEADGEKTSKVHQKMHRVGKWINEHEIVQLSPEARRRLLSPALRRRRLPLVFGRPEALSLGTTSQRAGPYRLLNARELSALFAYPESTHLPEQRRHGNFRIATNSESTNA